MAADRLPGPPERMRSAAGGRLTPGTTPRSAGPFAWCCGLAGFVLDGFGPMLADPVGADAVGDVDDVAEGVVFACVDELNWLRDFNFHRRRLSWSVGR